VICRIKLSAPLSTDEDNTSQQSPAGEGLEASEQPAREPGVLMAVVENVSQPQHIKSEDVRYVTS